MTTNKRKKTGKFKNAYRKSSLFHNIDRNQLYYEQNDIFRNIKFEYYRGYSPCPNYRGKYISTDEYGFRKTKSYMKPDTSLKVIHIGVFGTSTMFGGPSGGDDLTTPSFLSKYLNELDSNANYLVSNFAVGGYVSPQELLTFIEQLDQNLDLAIFVDGTSEFARALNELESFTPIKENTIRPLVQFIARGILDFPAIFINQINNRLFDFPGFLQKIYRSLGYSKPKHKILIYSEDSKRDSQTIKDSSSRQIKRIVELYKKNKRIIEAIAKEYGVSTIFVLEPFIYTKRTLSEEEMKILSELPSYETQFVCSCISQFRKLAEELCFWDFTDVFNENAETIFIDSYHTSKIGNCIIAKQLALRILENFKSWNFRS